MPHRAKKNSFGDKIARFSQRITEWAGSSWAFVTALTIIVTWGITGPLFHYSDTWQLVINTGTTIITFLMVFLIQRSQNKDALALQLKLNEIVAAIEGASNRLIDVESLSEDELKTLHQHYAHLAKMAKHEGFIMRSHSVEEADARHRYKQVKQKKRRSERDEVLEESEGK
jgi:low affinity Fe/Cu permease